MEKYLRLHSRLIDFATPRVMAIINLSRDSFYTSCDVTHEDWLLMQVQNMLQQGADILDLGACSTRPDSTPVTAQEEWNLLCQGLQIIRSHWPEVAISVDTFRADIAELALQHGADMINDVYGGEADARMWDVIGHYQVPYALTHAHDIVSDAHEYDPTMSQVLDFLQNRLNTLHRSGVRDVIVDPGFGFGKTVEQNYAILRQLDILDMLHTPILVGLSRKSMLYKPLERTPQDVLPATIAAHTIALQHGANILRVHDVEAAVQAIKIYELTYKNK